MARESGIVCVEEPRLRTNDNSLRLLTFCVENGIVVCSTFFQHKDIHLATWIGLAGDRANQIDFKMMRRRDVRYMQDCRVYRRTGFETDHYPLVGSCSFNLRRAPRPRRVKKYSARLMSDKNVQQHLNDIVAKQFSDVSQTGSSEDEWQQFKAAMQMAGNELLLEPTVVQESFLSDVTLELFELKNVAYLKLLEWRR